VTWGYRQALCFSAAWSHRLLEAPTSDSLDTLELLEIDEGRDAAVPALRAPVKGGGNSTVALRLASPYESASLLDHCLCGCEGRYLSLDVVNSMSPGFQVLLIAASVGP
jgi:hypothetical protein